MSKSNVAVEAKKNVQLMAPEAWEWFTNKTSLGNPDEFKVYSPQGYIPREYIFDIYKVLGEPLTLEQIQSIIVADGEPAVCETGVKFQPVRWVQFFQADLDRLKNGEDFAKVVEDVRFHGAFYPAFWLKEPKLLAFSGKPFFDQKKGDSWVVQLDWNSPLVHARNHHKNYWGEPREQAQAFLNRKKEERENHQAMINTVAAAFDRSREDRRHNGGHKKKQHLNGRRFAEA